MVVTLAGVEQVVAFTVSGVIGLQRTDGKLLWRVPLTTSYGRHVIAPVIYNDVVIVGSHEIGLVATRVVKKGATVAVEEAWKVGKELGPNFPSPVLPFFAEPGAVLLKNLFNKKSASKGDTIVEITDSATQ